MFESILIDVITGDRIKAANDLNVSSSSQRSSAMMEIEEADATSFSCDSDLQRSSFSAKSNYGRWIS